MPSAIPKADESVWWAPHSCGAKHPKATRCPRLNVWLIAGVPMTYLPHCTCEPGTIDHVETCRRGRAIRAGWRAQMGRS